MSSDINASPFPLLALLPEHGERSKRRKISPQVRNDGHDIEKIEKTADTITSSFALLELPAELHLCIIDHLSFWDVYALRLTCRHFDSITPPLNPYHDDERNLKAQFQLLYNQRQTEGGELVNLCRYFNLSWVARTSNLSYQTCRSDDCCCNSCGWTESSFPLLDLPPDLQLQIVDHLPFYGVATLRRTCRHFENIIPRIGKVKTEFEALYTETSAAGGNIDQMCEDFNFSWFGINYDLTYNEYGILNKGCSCGRDATSGYSEACGEEDCFEEDCCHLCVWGESNYDDYDSWTLKY